MSRAPASAPELTLVSPGTTFGWRASDAALARALGAAGCRVAVRRPRYGPLALRRTMLLTDAVEAAGAWLAGRGLGSPAVIFSSITAALLQGTGRPYAVRYDTLARDARPGPGGALQRRREPAVLAGARVLLPFNEAGAESARLALAGSGRPAPPIVVLPMAIEPVARAAPSFAAVAYAGNPEKRGLELLCRAWALARGPEDQLVVGGIGRAAALAHLARHGVAEPPGVQWAGALPRERWLTTVAQARVFVSAAHYEDWGIAGLEALSAGVPLVTVPARGPNEALPLARALEPGLVAAERTADALAAALRRGLAFGPAERDAYARAAEPRLAPYRKAPVVATLRAAVLPLLLAELTG